VVVVGEGHSALSNFEFTQPDIPKIPGFVDRSIKSKIAAINANQ
jgi:hypothetical protein